jgi:uncharacterized OsmC-like protein
MTASVMNLDLQPLVCNGVNVTAMMDTIEAVKADPSAARFQFRAANRWMGGGRNRSTIKGFLGAGREDKERTTPFTLDADEPPVLLGQDKAPNPVEFVLHALAACMTTSMAYHAALRGIDIKAIDSTIEGDLDLRGFLGLARNARKGFSQVRVRFRVKTAAPVTVLADLAKMSPVHDIIAKSLPVEVAIETY